MMAMYYAGGNVRSAKCAGGFSEVEISRETPECGWTNAGPFESLFATALFLQNDWILQVNKSLALLLRRARDQGEIG